MEIQYLGKRYKTEEDIRIISEEEYKKIKEMWDKKPAKKDVLIEMNQARKGGLTTSYITKYYFKDLMENTLKYYDKWSIKEVMENKQLVSVILNKINKNKKVFCSEDICENIDAFFRLGGKGFASKVSQFPQKTIDYILYEYNTNGKWYDFSCGWGARLLGSLKNKVDYFGTDPNNILVERLNELKKDYFENMGSNNSVDIRCCGSEDFIPEWEGKIGLAFSSPPYFYLEDYKIGKQSYKEGVSYQQWLDNYLEPTIKNIHRYLTQDGYFIINIKNFDKFNLEEDTIKIAEKNGFQIYKVDTLEQCERCGGAINSEQNKMTNQNENIFVFIKKGSTPKICHNYQSDIFSMI